MPVARNHILKCTSCGHTEVRVIGDVLPDKNMLKPCPKCGSRMKMGDVAQQGEDVLGDVIGRVKNMFER